MSQAPDTHPWIASLQTGLDRLERALLDSDPDGVEKASAQVQMVLQKAPKTAEFAVPGSSLRIIKSFKDLFMIHNFNFGIFFTVIL